MKVARKLPNGLTMGVYVDGRLNEMLEGFKNAVENYNTSVVMIVDGRSGMGKTTLANQIGIILDPEFDLDDIYYTPDKFLEALTTAVKGQVFLFDEAMLLSSRSALTEINKMVVQAMSMIRSKNIYIIFCVNSLFDLDRNLSIHRADVLLHVYGQTLIDRGRFASFFKGVDGHDRLKTLYLRGRKFYDYSQPRANFIGSFTKNFIVDEKMYEERKQEGINAFLNKGIKQSKAQTTRDNLIKYCYHTKKMSVVELSKVSGLSEAQIYNVLGLKGGQIKALSPIPVSNFE